MDADGLYFALGRTARSRQPILDSESGNFIEADFETAPYTHVLIDVSLQVAAVARKTLLAPNTIVLAHQMERVLANSRIAGEAGVTFSVSAMGDPDAFLNALKTAYAIRSFAVSFTKPNPFDVNELFLAPLERLLRETDGESGSATLKGGALREAPLEDLARSAAATGDDAKARLLMERGQKPVTKTLSGDTASITEDDLESPQGRAAALAKLRTEHRRVRRGNSDETT